MNDKSLEDLKDNSKKSYLLKVKLKKNLNQLGIDKYAYKAQQYFNKAQDKIEKSFKNISFDESLLKQSSILVEDQLLGH